MDTTLKLHPTVTKNSEPLVQPEKKRVKQTRNLWLMAYFELINGVMVNK